MFGKQKAAAIVAEFLGTGILTLVFLSVQRSTIGLPYFIALAAAVAVISVTFFFGDNSGAHLNPAITLALWTARKVGTVIGAAYIVAQLLGAWAAYGIYHYFVNTAMQPIGGHYTARVLIAEAVGTLVLALAWGYVAFKRIDNANRAFVIGGSYALAIIIAAVAGIGIANPAVALGVRGWDIWGSMGWGTYVLGPVLGALVGVNLYALLFAPQSSAAKSTASAEPAVASAAKGRSTTTRRTASRGTTKRSTARRSTGARRR